MIFWRCIVDQFSVSRLNRVVKMGRNKGKKRILFIIEHTRTVTLQVNWVLLSANGVHGSHKIKDGGFSLAG